MSVLSRNILANLIGQGLVLGLSFLALRYVFIKLGDDAVGIIYFSLTMTAVLTALLELGIFSLIVREVASHLHDEPEYIHDLTRTATSVYWLAYFVVGMLVFGIAPLLARGWINLRTMDPATAETVIRILALSSLLVLPQRVYASLFRGIQRMELNNGIDVAVVALQQIGTIALIFLQAGLLQVVVWLAACYLLGVLAYITLAAHLFTWRSLVPGYSSAVIHRNLGYSANLVAISFGSVAQSYADKLTIAKLLPVAAVGYYGVAYTLATRVSIVTDAISQAVLPSFSMFASKGDRAGLVRQYEILQELVCFAGAPVFAALPFAAIPLFSYIFDSNTAWSLLLPITFLSIGSYMHAALYTPHVLSLAMGKPQIAARATLFALVVVTPVTVLLVAVFGLTGASLAWVYLHVFMYMYFIPRVCRECLQLSTRVWYVQLLRAAAPAIAAYGLAWLLVVGRGDFSIPSLAIAFGAATVLFLSAGFTLIGPELRGSLDNLRRVFAARHARRTAV